MEINLHRLSLPLGEGAPKGRMRVCHPERSETKSKDLRIEGMLCRRTERHNASPHPTSLCSATFSQEKALRPIVRSHRGELCRPHLLNCNICVASTSVPDAAATQRTLPRAKQVSTGHLFTPPTAVQLFRVLNYPPHKKRRPNWSSFFMGWVMGLEPTTPGTTIRCSAN